MRRVIHPLSLIVLLGLLILLWWARGVDAERSARENENTSTANETWQSIGPMPVTQRSAPNDPRNFRTGRVLSVAIDPRDPQRWLVGSASGGLWISTDGGTTWRVVSEDLPSPAVGAIAFAPGNPDIIYTGTGEANFSRDTFPGAGLLKSTDGGQSWSVVGASRLANAGIGDIRIHPGDPNVLLVTTTRVRAGRFGDDVPVSMSPPRGVLKSVDGGVNWTRTLEGEATALQVHSANFNQMYAAIGLPCRPSCVRDNDRENGVYRSMDGGSTWARIDGPWTSIAAEPGRIELALAPSNPEVLYAAVQRPLTPGVNAQEQGILGIYRTDNAWAESPTWVRAPADATGPVGYCDRQCGSANSIVVDATNPSTLYAGGVVLWRCDECGATPQWTRLGIIGHVDYRNLVTVGNRLLAATDQGLLSSIDRGATWQKHTLTMSVAQLFSGALHPTKATVALTGAKDNGCLLWQGGMSWGGPNVDQHGVCEGEVAISASRPDTDWMSAADFREISRTRDGGQSFTAASSGIDEPVDRFTAAVRKCAHNDDVFLTGNRRLWRTDNFFSAGEPSWTLNGPENAGFVRGIAFADADASCNTYVFGTRDGRVWLTTDGGRGWRDITSGGALPARTVSNLAFGPDANTLYAALGNFDAATPGRGGHVFKTTNALAERPSWTDVSPPEDRPANVVLLEREAPSSVFVGSDTGVWHSSDGGSTWNRMGPDEGMPLVPVHDLKQHPATGQIFAFTFGRGAFVLDRPAPAQ